MDSPTPDLSLDELVARERRDSASHDAGGPSGDGGVVLPWWQNPINIATMLVTIALLAGMVGWLVGDSGADREHNDVDRGFLQDMRVHHEQAVLMSFIYRTRQDTDPGLRTIARSIVVGQSLEVGRMIQLLRDFDELEVNPDEASMLWMGMSATPGQMPGIASDEELDALAAADGVEADELFVELMTEHHRGGIEMAEFAAQNAADGEVIAFAIGMAEGQRDEIIELERQLG